jgi:hypothetical protein
MENYLKKNWTPQFADDFEQMPGVVKDLAGDLFEIKWYGYGGLAWELEHNLLGSKEKAEQFMRLYGELTQHQKNLIYYAYEA